MEQQVQPGYPQQQVPQQPQAHPMQQAPAGVSHEITHGPTFAMLRVDLPPGQTVIAEAGAMVAKHQHVNMEVKLNAGKAQGFFAKMKAFFIAFIRKIIGGETFFVNHFSAEQPGSVWLAPSMAGQIAHRRMQGESLVLSTGGYLAHTGDIDIKMKFGGLRGIFAKEGAFFLEISGVGDLWFTSYGGIQPIDVNGTYMVDNGHLVGYEGSLEFNVKSVGGGMMGFMASGEGLVCEFKGQGRVYIQSRNMSATVEWLNRIIP